MDDKYKNIIQSYVNQPRLKNEVFKWCSILMNNGKYFYYVYELDDILTIVVENTVYYLNKINIYNKNNSLYIKYSNSIKNEDIKSVIFEFNKNTSYPFSPPANIKVNNISYLSLLNLDSTFLKLCKLETNCLCCESLTCRNNWSTSNNIGDILNEIIKNMNYKKLYVIYLHIKIIAKKHLFIYSENLIFDYLV